MKILIARGEGRRCGREDWRSSEEGSEDSELALEEEKRIALEKQNAMGFGFTVASQTYEAPKSIPTEPPDDVIGRYGFRRMILNGSLLLKEEEYSQQVIDHLFDEIDVERCGMISFYQFWQWFSYMLGEYNENYPEKAWLAQTKGLLKKELIPFTSYRIVNLEERALLRFIDSRKV